MIVSCPAGLGAGGPLLQRGKTLISGCPLLRQGDLGLRVGRAFPPWRANPGPLEVLFLAIKGEKNFLARCKNGEFGMDVGIEEYGNSEENRKDSDFGKNWKAKTALGTGGVLVFMAAVALVVDAPLARWVQEQNRHFVSETPSQEGPASSGQMLQSAGGKLYAQVKRVLTWAEGFGHGLGVLLLALMIYRLDPPNRRRLVRALCMALASGLAADGVKLLVARTRPRAFDLSQPILESFTGIVPGLVGGSGGQSFPSAHVATAVGWALGLGWLYPGGRWIFVLLAFLVLCQRLDAHAHFLSDCLAGASVGCLVSSLFLPGSWLSKAFDRWETSSRRWIPYNGPSHTRPKEDLPGE